ncbi:MULTISPECIES: RNA polymerase sigma factor [Saccharibacillus]|uniref:RNA polymerase sigma factor n=1 Tax=Saccharibacillus brassicae TaxID=2583377 RepID=A0A4Y6V0I2_SACBS|nr:MULTISPECIES: RNA polymerase sigma factor [Saccharibacillus]MWJ30806.1 sigma-70 family RNA polymerase sigma factor [Saccharibacillus sp. WB 17]QDH22298.1 RNA polymerase sigma factor [Saccharibacillus brassicae]
MDKMKERSDGEMEAIDPDTVVRTHWGDVWKYLFFMSGSRVTADDLTQDTFVKALRSLDRFRRESSLKTWLMRIARNTYVNHKRSAWMRRVVPSAEIEPDRMAASAEKAYLAEAGERRVWELVFRLPDKLRETLLLEAHYGMTAREGAELLGIPEGTYKSRLSRARSRMDRLMEEEERA